MTSPFGVPFSEPINSLDIHADYGSGKHGVRPPTPHPLFSEYILQATEELGVVWIKGISAPIENDKFGNSLRALVDRIASQLATRYGQGKKTDLLLPGSIWNEPQDWMSALEANELLYSYIWTGETHPNLPQDIETIYVGAASVAFSSGLAVLEYSSTQMQQAESELERGMSDLL